jgi:hypothetical protein
MLARKALAGTAGAPKEYVEDVFSTYLYTGSGATKTITNDIDLSGEGGMVWIKARSTAYIHCLYDTERGALNTLTSNTADASISESGSLTAFNADGFTLGSFSQVNHSSSPTYVAWTFRQAKKFFDVVTYTGTGSARTVAHNLGSVPGCIIVKRTDSSTFWAVYHTSLGNTKVIFLNDTDLAATSSAYWNNTSPTSTNFTVGTDSGVNANGGTYVAYLFAHDAGGFGASGSDNVITCGSYTGNGADNGPTVTLGYEPQWVLVKRSDSTGGWRLIDNMRGNSLTSQAVLSANSSSAESTTSEGRLAFTATGFKLIYGSDSDLNSNGGTYIYIAIRRGPMKTPTSATSVFEPIARSGTGSTSTVSTVLTDLVISHHRNNSVEPVFYDRLRGATKALRSSTTAAESTYSDGLTKFDSNSGYVLGADSSGGQINFSGVTYANWNLRRAPGFFDVVCYTGNGSTQTITHNLGVTPELIIAKNRTTAGNNWPVLFNFASTTMSYGFLNSTSAGGNNTYANVGVFSAAPTSTSMFLTNSGSMNASGDEIVAYLFASITGISKVGSYTGNGSSQTINCGFTGGARFVLLKATSTTGDWVVFDSARGIVSGNDPYLELNTTDAEVTDKDAVDTDNTGFVVNETTGPNVNTNGATYIYFSVA